MLTLLIVMMFDWHRFRRLPKPARIAAGCLAGTAFFAGMISPIFGSFDLIQWVNWTLPANPLAATAVTLGIVAALYWAVQTLFRQLEFIFPPGTPWA
jgi:hypothetical protein